MPEIPNTWEARFENITAKDVDEDGKVVDKPLPLTQTQDLAVKGFITAEIAQAKIEQLVWVLKQIPPEGNEWLGKVRSGLEGLVVDYSGRGAVPKPDDKE